MGCLVSSACSQPMHELAGGAMLLPHPPLPLSWPITLSHILRLLLHPALTSCRLLLRRLEEPSPHGEDQFEVAASLRVEMRAHNTDGPYVQRRGEFRARFSLQYASVDDVLPLVGAGCRECGVMGGKQKSAHRVFICMQACSVGW